MASPEPSPASPGPSGFWSSRLGLSALRYPIPVEATTLRYSLGAFTFACFLILVITGIWLGQFYNPNPAAAHDSVLYIITRAPFGDIARSLHYWSAAAMFVSIVAHIAWVFYRRAYRAPREITWYAGLGLASLVFLMIITGSILRYDQEGYEALAHFLAGGELTGMVGQFFTNGFTLSTPVLARIYSLHASLLPLGMAALIALHFWLVRVLGISGEGRRSESFSGHLPKITGGALVLLAVLLTLAVLRPEGLGYPAVPGYEITKPFWPLLWIYALESLTGMWALVWAPAVVFAFLAVVPLLDRGPVGRATVGGLRGVALTIFLVLVALGVWAAVSPPQQHLGM